MRFLITTILFVSTIPLFAQFPAADDTFHIEGNPLSYKLYYHDLRVRETVDLKPLIWKMEEEFLQQEFRKARLLEFGSIGINYVGSVMVAGAVAIRVSGGPWIPELAFGGGALVLLGRALEFSQGRRVLGMVHRYNYMVRENYEFSWQLSPVGGGIQLRF